MIFSRQGRHLSPSKTAGRVLQAQQPPTTVLQHTRGRQQRLAELDGQLGSASSAGWLQAPTSAFLLPAGVAMRDALDRLLSSVDSNSPFTLKWKVAACDFEEEWCLLQGLLDKLPFSARVRLDANGGWDRLQAWRWVEKLRGDPRLQWLEQPLAVDDWEGLQTIASVVPVALDESLQAHPTWRDQWQSWQVRRPLLEGDPRPLLQDLLRGKPRLMLSTTFETGIGGRWLAHLAALQAQGETPAAPGLAPGWCPAGPLFSSDPAEVWAAAEVSG
ncbi:enolase C-terminal domain-like protein [Synechococcus sp. MU1655]|uniref:enolase C-terminal domain-like protein n=1 Tax=Synechococcus sp. MU1655 TaxID=2508355 RepID=UPI002026744E|nr:enolase C-terminal domain-like protein [Synechococcus sp. MU1655]